MIDFSGPTSPARSENRIFVSLVHPDRCEHDDVERESADWSVGIMTAYVVCNDCGADLTDDDAYNDPDPWDDGDRRYDEWKDSQLT